MMMMMMMLMMMMMMMIKPTASNFARRFIGVQGRESHILGNFASTEAENRTDRPAREPRPPGCKRYRRDAAT